MCQDLSLQHPVDSSQQPREQGAMITPILQTRKQKLREVQGLAQGHTAGTWQSLDLDLGLFGPKAHLTP